MGSLISGARKLNLLARAAGISFPRDGRSKKIRDPDLDPRPCVWSLHLAAELS